MATWNDLFKQDEFRWKNAHGQGQEIEPNTFILNVGADAGVPHHYSDLAEIADLFQHFVIRQVEQEEYDEGGHRHSHWQVLVEKD